MTDEATTVVTPDMRAEQVEISQTSASNVDAEIVSISQGAAGQVRAREVTLSQGAIGLARADRVQLGEGSSAFALMANEAKVDAGATIMLLVSGETSGDVRPLLDLPTALAIGAGFGLAIALLRRLL